MKERKEINEKYKWDLSDYCSNDEEFIKELNYLKTEIKMTDIKMQNRNR